MDVGEEWARLRRWLSEHLPQTEVTIAPGSSLSEIEGVQNRLGIQFPEQLIQLLLLQDGSMGIDTGGRDPVAELQGFILPGAAVLCSLDSAVETWTMWRDIYDEGPNPATEREADQAGTASQDFLTSFFPVGDLIDGDCYYVDCRPGPLNGCVGWHVHDDDSFYPALWPSLAAMLHSTADTLERWQPWFIWQPVLEEGHLNWAVVPVDLITEP